jgi:cupin fold WbuC family metalloprotein
MSETTPEAQRAMAAPPGALNVINARLIEQTIEASRRSPRRRMILPLHKGPADRLHRMLNAVQPGSYVRPHRHQLAGKAEAIVVLRGAIHFVTYGEDGSLDRHLTLSANSPDVGVDIEPAVYHTFFALQPDTVVFEVKPGPYDATLDKEFAPWAPDEGSPAAPGYLARLQELPRMEM